jgi:hypothetical protein
MYQKILALLAKLPSDSPSVDWVVIALVIAGAIAVATGVVTPDQLPTLIDAALYGLVGIGVRGASLAAKAKAATGASVLANAVSDVRSGKAVPTELVEHAVELLNVVSSPKGAK